MPRKPREEEAGAIHHVYARGNAKRLIYEDDVDRRTYVRLLEMTVALHGWLVLAYCLMDNHVHLLVETPRPTLGPGMQRLHGDYALLFNDRHGRCGHLFQGRYGAKRIRDDAQLVTTVRYLAANPVEAGLCREPHAWPWGSVHYAAEQRGAWLAHERLLAFLGGIGGGRGADRYAEIVAGCVSGR